MQNETHTLSGVRLSITCKTKEGAEYLKRNLPEQGRLTMERTNLLLGQIAAEYGGWEAESEDYPMTLVEGVANVAWRMNIPGVQYFPETDEISLSPETFAALKEKIGEDAVEEAFGDIRIPAETEMVLNGETKDSLYALRAFIACTRKYNDALAEACLEDPANP